MKPEANQPNQDRSPAVLQRLAAADRCHQREVGSCFLLRCAKYLFALVIILFALDVFLHLDSGWRLALGGLFLALALALFGRAAWLAWRSRNQLERIARFLESRDPALGSKLINLLQLRSQSNDATLAPLTRELAQQAVAGYSEALRGIDFEQLARTPQLRIDLKRAGWALLAFAAVLGIFAPVTTTELARYFDPLGDHPPYSLTHLEIVDPGSTGTNVIYGKSFVVKVKISGHEPNELFLTAHPPGKPNQALTLPMFGKGRAGHYQQLDNINGELVVYAHTRDRHSISKQARIGVILTPQLDKASVQIAPPAYTGLKPEEQPYTFKSVQALAGSRVQFRFKSNRPLREGVVEVAAGEGAPQRVAMSPSGANEVTGSFEARESGRLVFSLVDRDGIPSQDRWEGALTVTHDLPPEITITEPSKDCYVAMDFKVQAQISATDDYGIRTIRLHRALNGTYSAPKIVNYAGIVRDAHETLDFDFAALGVAPGDVISFFAEAIDTAPEEHLARSQTVNLHLISVEDYNEFVRERTDLAEIEQKYQALEDQLQDLIDEQRKLGEKAAQLKEQLAKAGEKDKAALQQQLDSLLAKQSEINTRLNQEAEHMENFVRKDPVYDVETELQDALRKQAEAIRKSTSQNDAASRDVAQRSSPSQGPRQLDESMPADLKRASDEQVARLAGGEKQARKELAETLQNMSQMQELQKDFNQFEMLYNAQRSLAEQARAYNREGTLERQDQLALKNLAATERDVAELMNKLEDKLRADAKAAEKLFPKAAASGKKLADSMEELRLQPLARQATSEMLAGNGENSFNTADRLRSEMEKLFGECKGGGNSPEQTELDQYLSLSKGMKPGNNFAQMSRSKKFGKPGSGQSRGGMSASGEGAEGESGSAVMTGDTIDVRGNESQITRSDVTSKQSADRGQGAGNPNSATSGLLADKPDVMKGLNPVKHQSGAVSSESLIEEYSDVVDRYFKSIAREGGKK